MGLKCGIVGLPNVGKSTLFNCLTASQLAEAANYPFCTIEPNVGVVIVPDKRVDELVNIYNPKKIVKTVIEFVDIAGLVAGASKGEGLGNQFLSHIREVDAIIHIVRCFENEDIVHVPGKIDPKADIEIIETELILKDLESLENRMQKTEKLLKSNDKNAREEYEAYKGLKKHLESGRLAKYFVNEYVSEKGEEKAAFFKELQLLTNKHILYVANVDDKNIHGNEYSKIVEEIAAKEDEEAIVLSVEIEAELSRLEPEEEMEFLKELGIEEPGLDKLIHKAYSLLGLLTFFTAGEKEVHAWTVHKGAKGPQAAGEIHTDFEKGYIRAEVMSYEDLITYGSEHAVREKGLMRVEGKEYEVRDGDVMYFRFNV
ncbi:MAG: redox-regulated ATPase YchF [Ignavibacteriae bacterium]|nr:MAG: redox-regulated ATPase YchF [Ignavibacteriota bacterium]